ncbi:CRISPR-associated protein Csx16 [Woodsholea maritima]|uniref:CRISPR-associated protein Csx16 n=1 Tax=Woodsholea maritima TaxID=240237 RepID=UPI0004774804|nr:CRISPR-associated protein Csx16 [Woodsholea maritima]
MVKYFSSRHHGAIDWMMRHHPEFKIISSLFEIDIIPGYIIAGNFPLSLAAEICAKGARLFSIDMNLAPDLRGTELTAEQMEISGAKLVEYYVSKYIYNEN